MAVENKYVNAQVVAGKLAIPAASGAGEVIVARAVVAVAAADDNGSVYRLFKAVPSELIPLRIDIQTTAITGGTDYDLGLYNTDLGTVVDADCLMDGQTMATAAKNLDGLGIVAAADAMLPLWDLAAGVTLASKKGSYDIALTANTVGTADGTIVVTAYFTHG